MIILKYGILFQNLKIKEVYMEQKAERFIHPISNIGTVLGIKIEPGTVLEENDVYASTTGKWENCPCPGVMLQNSDVFWVRPV